MNILLIEPYFTGSHKSWALGLQKRSTHQINILSLPGKFWKWRMHGGAVTLARQFMDSDYTPDLILTTDMLDLTTFLSLTRERTSGIATAVYFHENQLSYPWSKTDRDVQNKRNIHYGFINFTTALTANHVLFNSQYHMDSFLFEIRNMLKHFPDNNELTTIDTITSKSSVLHLGLDLLLFDQYRIDQLNHVPLLLWNHRWEYDKNPEAFFKVLLKLTERGLAFEVSILGENFKRKPDVFDSAVRALGNKVVHNGYVENFKEYAEWLWKADILPVTSNQDFFGASIMEAIYCNTYPLLPNHLTYPELIPKKYHPSVIYNDLHDLEIKLESLIESKKYLSPKLRAVAKNYRWKNIISEYDSIFEQCRVKTL
ncbi:MAG: DUF3524 domain-containing protein [Candidatus Marinimicrobia bacterium]|nr:DUF3524 domain-containing protein [Candidatus Neomarinimicrobiota bacterium]